MNNNKISLTTAILMNINLMIGAGVYVLLPLMVEQAGSASFLSWALSALIVFPIVWSVAQLAKQFPGEGSFYSYSKNTMGSFAGFLGGWLYFLAYASVAALQTLGLRDVLMNAFNISIFNHYPLLFVVPFVLFIFFLNLFSMRIVGKIQSAATLLKLVPLIFVPLVMLFYWHPHNIIINSGSLAHIPKTIPLAIFGLWGFECCASVSHLIEGDARNAYRAILIGFCSTIAIYTLFHLGVLNLMGADNVISQGVVNFVSYLHIPYHAIQQLLYAVISASMCMALIGGVLACSIANSSLLYAMAHENLFFMSSFIRSTNAQQRPWVCLALQACTSLIFITVINNKYILNAVTNFGIISTFFLALFALLIVQFRRSQYTKAVITILAFGSCKLLAYYSWFIAGSSHLERLTNILPLLILALGGALMYGLKRIASYYMPAKE